MTTSVEKVDRFLEVLLPVLKQKLSDELGVVGQATVEAFAPALEDALDEAIVEADPDSLDEAIAAVAQLIGGLRSDDAEPLLVAPSQTPPIPLDALQALQEGDGDDASTNATCTIPTTGTCDCPPEARGPWCDY